MEPLNYSIDVKSPFEQSLVGLQTGLALSDLNAKRQDAERQRQLQIQMQGDLAALAQNKNPTARDYATVMTRYPQISEHLKRGFDILQPEQQQAKLSDATQIYSALNSGATDVAIKLLSDRATGLRNSGKLDDAKAAETVAKLIEMNPATAKTTGALWLSSVMGPDKFAATFPAIGKESRESALAPSQLQESEGKARQATAEAAIKEIEAGNSPESIRLKNENTRATISKFYSDIQNNGDRLSLDKDRLRSDVEKFLMEFEEKKGILPDDARKLVNESAVASVAARQHSQQLLNIATQFDKLDPVSGIPAMGAENIKKFFGGENEITNLRKEYTRLRNTDVMKMLPPGSASDKDVKFALDGFPSDKYNSTEMATFLRGMAKMSQFDSVLSAAKAEWVNNNTHLGSARKDLMIDGVRVPAGTTFADFSAQFMKRKAEQLGAEQSIGQARTLGRGYLRYGEQPQPAVGASGAY